MAKRFKLNIGDVFTIPLNENEVGFGQCITQHKKTSGGFVIAIFPIKQDKNKAITIEEIVKHQPIFLGYTFDAKLYHKDWEIIGNNTSNIMELKLPYNRLGTPPEEFYLTDVESNRVAKITEDVFNTLTYKTEIAPIRYENALKAYFGLQEWKEEDYDKILYKHTLKSNEIAQHVLGKER
jgi:hypothetical protein